MPTAANLAGDWSATGTPLVDPRTGAKLVGNKYPSPPNYNAQSLKLLSYLPKPDPNDPTGRVFYSIPLQTADNQFVTRVDFTINSKHNVYGRYFIDGYQQPAFFFPDNILVTTQAGLSQRVQSFTFGDAYTISPRMVNTAHITVMRRRNNRGYAANNINATDLGVDLYQGQANGLQMTTSNKFNVGGGTNSNSKFNDNTLAFDDDITLMMGKHQLVFGREYARNQLNIANAYETNGVFTFDGRYSRNEARWRIGGRRSQSGLPDGNPRHLRAEQAAAECSARPHSESVHSGYLSPNRQCHAHRRSALEPQLHALRLLPSRGYLRQCGVPRQTE